MPSSDLVLNVRQIAGYDLALNASPADTLLMQRGLGGPYLSISPASLVSTALAGGGDMAIGGQLLASSIQGGAGQFSNLATGLFNAANAGISQLDAAVLTIAGQPAATQEFVVNAVAGGVSVLNGLYATATVWSFNGRSGAIALDRFDVMAAGGAPAWSPSFSGVPTTTIPDPLDSSNRIPTTSWTWGNICWAIKQLYETQPLVFSFNGRSGDVTLTMDDIVGADAALLQSPAFVGTPTAPTAPPSTNTDQLATTAFVAAAIGNLTETYAPLVSPQFSGYPTAPTANPGTSTAQLATTAFVMNAVAASVTGVASFNTRTGNVTLELADVTGVGGAPLASPVFTGDAQAPTVAAGDASNHIATTAWVANELGGANVGVMSFNARSGAVTLTTSDVTAAGGAPLASPALTGTPTAPTAAVGTATQQLATTAFVMGAITGGSVTAFNGRTGAITLTANDVTAAGGLANPSPAITGAPTAPTAAAGTSSTQIATTAFVTAAIAANAVTSFNGRTGAVTLGSADITAAGGALLASPAFTGVPTAPTAAISTLNTQVATTAFVRDFTVANFLPLAGGVLSGGISFNVAGLTGSPPTTNLIGFGAFSSGAQDSSGWSNNTFSSIPLSLNGTTMGWMVRTTMSAGVLWPVQVIATNTGLTLMSGYGPGNNIVSWSVNTCDERVKENLEPAADGLAVVNSVPVYACTYHRPGQEFRERWNYTLVAQQVRDALPFAYMEPPPGGYASLHPLHLIATLWKAVQQLTDRLAALEGATP